MQELATGHADRPCEPLGLWIIEMMLGKHLASRVGAVVLGGLLLSFFPGCGGSPPATFRLNMEGRSPDQFSAEQKQLVVDILTAAFGTPDDPYIFPETGLDLEKLRIAAGPTYSEAEGVRHGLFRQHCAHCHGVTGDGAGPTAAFLNPYPRDFRKGVFKFTSTGPGAKPTTDDLKKTLRNGIQGTAMPSFVLLPEAEIEALVEYVKYLSIRGQVEASLFLYLENEEDLPESRDALLDEVLLVSNQWRDAESQIVVPDLKALPPRDSSEELAASIERGRALFRDAKTAQCIKCHGPTGLGDGNDEGDLFDDWNKEKDPAHPELWALPKQKLRPRNLRLGIYRGGRAPADIYRRIFAGIKGTPMPAAGKVLKPNQIWDLVNYVLQLPYEPSPNRPEETTKLTRARL